MATSKPSSDRVRADRERQRRQRLRRIQFWVPDLRAPAFRAQAHRQSLAVAQSTYGDDDQAFIDAASHRER
jgi:hypothetical protein